MGWGEKRCREVEELQNRRRATERPKRSISMGLHKHRAALSVFSCVVVLVLNANQTVS